MNGYGGLVLGFAGTRYDTFLTKLQGQKGSYLAFNAELARFKEKHPEAKFEDVLPLVDEFFGLKHYPKDEMNQLTERAAKGDVEAVVRLGMALKEYEAESLEKAFAMTMKPSKERPVKEDNYYISYGTYEPLTVTLTHILNQKSGIGWTTFSHSGLPTPVSAVGVGAEMFNGCYDNTDIFKKIVELAKY